MPMRSHVDPCTFVVYIHFARERLGDELIAVLRDFAPRQGAPSEDVLDHLPERGHQVRFHEDYHFWQGLRLPFVLRYAFLSFRQAMSAFAVLAKQEKDWTRWDCMLPEFERLSLEERIGFGEPGVLHWGRDLARMRAALRREERLSPLDLLECAASIAEFQVSARGDLSDPVVFGRWTKRNPASLLPFEFAAEFLGDARLALRCVLPLVNAAFHTSEPVRSFVELLGRVWANFVAGDAAGRAFLARPEPCRWSELFAHWLDGLPYEAAADSDGRILGSPYHRLTLGQWVGSRFVDGAGAHLFHPFLGLPARAWEAEQAVQPEYGLLMDQPGWVRNATFWRARRRFSPTLTVFRCHLGGADDRVFFAGADDGRGFTSLPMQDPAQWRGYVADVLAIHGAVRRASGAHFDAAQRTCHHAACPWYASNFCNTYPIVPKDHRDCGFPARMRRLIDTLGR